MAIAFVRRQSNENGGSSGTYTYSGLTSSVTGNGLIIVLGRFNGSGESGYVTGVSDSASNGWTEVGHNLAAASFSRSINMWYVPNATSMNSLTVTTNLTQTRTMWFDLYEFSGLATSSLLDAQGSNNGGGSTIHSGTASTSNNDDVIIAAAFGDGNMGGPTDSNYTCNSFDQGVSGYRIVSSTGSHEAVFTGGNSTTWASLTGAFKGPTIGNYTGDAALTGAGTLSPDGHRNLVLHLDAVANITGGIDLTWDAVGITGVTYDIERDGTIIAWQHSGNSYADTGLTPNTTYTYRVRAVQ